MVSIGHRINNWLIEQIRYKHASNLIFEIAYQGRKIALIADSYTQKELNNRNFFRVVILLGKRVRGIS